MVAQAAVFAGDLLHIVDARRISAGCRAGRGAEGADRVATRGKSVGARSGLLPARSVHPESIQGEGAGHAGFRYEKTSAPSQDGGAGDMLHRRVSPAWTDLVRR